MTRELGVGWVTVVVHNRPSNVDDYRYEMEIDARGNHITEYDKTRAFRAVDIIVRENGLIGTQAFYVDISSPHAENEEI